MVWGEQTLSVLLAIQRIAAAAGFVTAGLLMLARWRLTAEARSAQLGVALVLLGGMSLPLFQVARRLTEGRPDSLFAPVTRLLATAVVLALVARALRAGRSSRLQVRPAELVVRAALLTSAGFLVLVTTAAIWPGLFESDHATPRMCIETVLIAGWAGLAAWSWRRRAAWRVRLGWLLAGLGLAEAFRLIDQVQPGPWRVAAAALTLLVALVTTYDAAVALFDAASRERRRVADLSGALRDANETVTQHEAWREELTHDLHNALTGLRAALHTLDSYGPQLDDTSASELREAAMDEVAHVEHLVTGADQAEVVDYQVVPLVRSVVQTRRATGQDVKVQGTAGLVRGRPGDLVTVLQNLLVNASVHAPGCPVTVEVVAHRSRVEVIVSDRGPGISAERAEQVFTRGERGPESSGSGLGLYVARSLMRKHGGDVELRSHVGGTTFAVVLAAVERRASAPDRAASLSRST